MTHESLAAESARELFQNSGLLQALAHHPVLAVTAALWLSVAYACVQLAIRKGRDDQVWGTLALLFGAVPLIVLLVLPSQAAPACCGD